MDILTSLFLDEYFDQSYLTFKKNSFIINNGLYLRLICSEKNIDDRILIDIEGVVDYESNPYKMLKDRLERNKLLRILSGKKVHARLKNDDTVTNRIVDTNSPDHNGFISMTFSIDGMNGTILLSRPNLLRLLDIIGMKFVNDINLFTEDGIEKIRKCLYMKISSPPQNFGEAILNLNNADLQLVLNRLLHLRLVSLDMLASYVLTLGKRGQKITDNLSRQTRDVIMKMTLRQRIYSSSRLARQVYYVINRNIYKSVDELGINMAGLEKIRKIRLYHLFSRLERQLSHKNISSWFETLDLNNGLRELLNVCPRRALLSAISRDISRNPGSNIGDILERHISKNGMKTMFEDIAAFESDPVNNELQKVKLLLQCFRKIKEIYYTPIVKDILEKGGYSARCSELPKDTNDGGTIDMIVDEIGIARTIYALRNLDGHIVSGILGGVLKSLYDDVIDKKVRFSDFGEFSSAESQQLFLRTILILSDEGAI